jgi:hypothetical protein
MFNYYIFVGTYFAEMSIENNTPDWAFGVIEKMNYNSKFRLHGWNR